jgi:hypothetical protein
MEASTDCWDFPLPLFLFLSQDWLCIPGWLRTPNPAASVSQVLGLQV